MDDTTRAVAWAIAQAWWTKTHRRAAGALPEAATAEDYANEFWQTFSDEARAAIAVLSTRSAASARPARVASNRFV